MIQTVIIEGFKKIMFCLLIMGISFNMALASEMGSHSKYAESFINDNFQNIINIAQKSKSNPREVHEELSGLLENILDYKLITMFVVGSKHWRQITDSMVKDDLIMQYKYYLVDTYISRLQELTKYNMIIDKVKYKRTDVRGYEMYEVRTTFVKNNVDKERGINVMYLLKLYPGDKSDCKIIDIEIESISMTITHKSEFSDILNSKGIYHFIDILKEKNKANDLTIDNIA